VTHLEFSRNAAIIAKNAADWAADCLTMDELAAEPMKQEALDRFVKSIRERLKYIETGEWPKE
jgi:hypothetical protein